MNEPNQVGTISWMDLTVPQAETVLDFYKEVVGWSSSAVEMGGYQDFCVHSPAGGDAVAGICHSRGVNANLPPAWLIYITVADVADSARKVTALGGEILFGPKGLGGGQFCVIRDPAGAVCALYQAGESKS